SPDEIQRRIKELPAIAGEVPGQAVSEAGKAGPTDAGIFSDLVPKKTEGEKGAPPPTPAAEDAGIFSDLVPQQPVKIEEPAPAPAGPVEAGVSPAAAEAPPSIPAIDLGTATLSQTPPVPPPLVPGNIDLTNRPVVQNPDGTVSTEKSFSIGTDAGEVLIPQVVNGKGVSQQEAVQHYKDTGEHLGIFETPAQADAYAGVLHQRQGITGPDAEGGLPTALP